MLGFDIVKRIGEGNYLNEDSFIIERVRKERALKRHTMEVKGSKFTLKVVTVRNGKRRSS